MTTFFAAVGGKRKTPWKWSPMLGIARDVYPTMTGVSGGHRGGRFCSGRPRGESGWGFDRMEGDRLSCKVCGDSSSDY